MYLIGSGMLKEAAFKKTIQQVSDEALEKAMDAIIRGDNAAASKWTKVHKNTIDRIGKENEAVHRKLMGKMPSSDFGGLR